MGLVSAIILLFLGLLAATDFVTALVPATEKILEAVKPYRGWIGLVFAVWGVWGIISAVLNLGLLSYGIRGLLWWLTLTVMSALEFGVGFLVGFEKIAELTGKGDQLEQLREKLAPHMRTMGLVSIGMAAWALVASFILAP